ncbi:MAG: tRNA pseudouridine(38-40) synthase TruA [Gallionellales bacterium 35-53-114]|jgi:tRNA pseudouridine38-40 synthase|nr:MAG: tRNA pseudouridine(38-40) synthase TruA [Gallionellales bacterium 35-53-114]OYZ62810.1 MAG: tRNA pseudouridine(38-40) synthase TruA [Gallionellales bacterium 24-53-125]OZB09885.1 MAG: tRNA pseudouridine(38-40) synthase TruA [Gallionellales bacterium 39-52-133]HQS57547.1 tRNA pseudouridine(38-40) synthase TruA [Gallionellaceae bacterium]HQS74001.1 tRNA pseudouridine(38-40) synthase TruA [Gallionellaceae bacterium]
MRIALGVEYDGSAYCGWQSQPDGRTVQDVVQLALGQIAGELISVIAAGRTDTGVHALEQVIHFDTQALRPLTAWVRGVNALLPSNIAVLWAHLVDDEFHARFSAQARSYSYYLYCRQVRSALQHGKVGWFHQSLDVDKMREAAQYLLGEHDFSAFRASACQAKSPVKSMNVLDIQQQGEMIRLDLTANAFLHHMVRNIVGCLVYVGKGKHQPQWIKQVLEGRERSQAAPTFSPDGLYLRRITYDAKWGLPQLK